MILKYRRLSHDDKINLYRTTLRNVNEKSSLAKIMAGIGFTKEKLAEAELLLKETIALYDLQKHKEDLKKKCYQEHSRLKNELVDVYRLDRKKAKYVWSDDDAKLKFIGINGATPTKYDEWLSVISLFYHSLSKHPDLFKKISIIDFPENHLNNTIKKIDDLVNLRNDSNNERINAKKATHNKYKSFNRLDKWFNKFYSGARLMEKKYPGLLDELKNSEMKIKITGKISNDGEKVLK